jgi:RNA polymerase sigma-70 factor (ECF subfamily)
MVEAFESYRTYLFAIAYRMLGSAMDAQDMVQETYLRYSATPKDSITSLKAYLTTIITRLCMDQLHLARRKRDVYLGPWLPEPLITPEALEAVSLEERVDMEESISLAFLLLLEQLQPIERAVFLLREVFEYDYAEIATFLGKSEVSCRQWFSRAKKHLGDHRPRFPTSPDTHRQMLTGFLQAAQAGEMAPLMNLLAEDVTLWVDSGGKVKGAATHPIHGRDAVARFSLGTRRFLPEGARVELTEVNGQLALIFRAGDRAYLVLTIDLVPVGNALRATAAPSSDREGSIEVEAQRIQTIRIVVNPDKLMYV